MTFSPARELSCGASTLLPCDAPGTPQRPAPASPHAASAPLRSRLRPRLAALRRRLLRLDVLWSLVYLLMLLCVAVPTAAVTQVCIVRSLRGSWGAVHHARVHYITERISISTTSVHDIANGFMAVNTRGRGTYIPEDPLPHLCASLDNYDKMTRFRVIAYISLARETSVGCMHGIPGVATYRTLTAFYSVDGYVNGTYLVDSETYELAQPLTMMTEWPAEYRHVAPALSTAFADAPIMTLIPAYLNGSIDRIDQHYHWVQPASMPHLLCYTLPLGYLVRGVGDIGGANYTDFTQVRLDGSRMLLDYDFVESPGLAVVVFIRSSLSNADPFVMSNNWGQPSVSNDSLYTTALPTPLTYLKASEINSPLMQAALQHVDLKVLQSEGSNQTVEFEFNGAIALATAYGYTTIQGLVVPIVIVSSHAAVTLPYLRLMRIFDVVLAVVVALFTGLFFASVRRLLSQPLRRLTTAMVETAKSTRRVVAYRTSAALVQLREVRNLVRAYNATVRQLSEIKKFVPEALQPRRSVSFTCSSASTSQTASDHQPTTSQHTNQGNRAMHSHVSTVVYVTIMPTAAGAPAFAPAVQPSPRSFEMSELDRESKPRRGQRLVTIVEQAAVACRTGRSGPFPDRASLADFIATVNSLSRRHHGTAHRVCPDGCVLHFNRAVRRVLPTCTPDEAAAAAVAPAAPAAARTRHGVPAAQSQPPPAPTPMQRAAAQDARDAAAFALALTRWVDNRGGGDGAMPDVRALLDTALFTCGQYRPLGSEQTLQVALGRDVQRDVGGVPRRIGVRVAMTEETAVRVRDAASGGGAADAEADADAEQAEHAEGRAGSDGAGGVRAIPVEALRTGRAGLDAQSLVLYEALPGRVAGDAAWQAYARCCDDGFALMLRGDYASARRVYGGVADIADLEPGLLPPSLSREAARSDVRGGAVSTQVARLVRECEARVASKMAEPLCKSRLCPLGIDALVRHAVGRDDPLMLRSCGVDLERSAVLRRSIAVPRRHSKSRRSSSRDCSAPVYPAVADRFIVEAPDTWGRVARCVVPSPPSWVVDNNGTRWQLAACNSALTPESFWRTTLRALGPTGVVATASYLVYRDAHPLVAKRIADAQLGVMCNALRSAVPVCLPSAEQSRDAQTLFEKQHDLRHPGLISILAYSQSLEGGVVVLWGLHAGGTLRQVLHRYPCVKAVTLAKFLFHVLSALAFVHEHGVAHGTVHLDNVLVTADGGCRLSGCAADRALSQRLYRFPRTCYMSPRMAVGALPTPECDMFCFGLLTLEAATLKPAWRWTKGDDGQPRGTAKELEELMKAGGLVFSEAILAGGVVAHLELLDAAVAEGRISDLTRDIILACTSPIPEERPTAVSVREALKGLMVRLGAVAEEDLSLSSSIEMECLECRAC